MSKLTDLLEAVREQGLTKTSLENYHTQLTNLFAQMMLEMAELEKKEARYFYTMKLANPESSDIAIKRAWKAEVEGLRLIELARFSKAIEKVLSSVKNRIYSQM